MKFASDNLSNLRQLVEGDPSFLWILPKLKEGYTTPDWMRKLVIELENAEFKKDPLVSLLRDFAKREKLKFGKMMQTMRMLLSSKKDGYQIAEMMEILGKDGTIHRLSRSTVSNEYSDVKQIN